MAGAVLGVVAALPGLPTAQGAPKPSGRPAPVRSAPQAVFCIGTPDGSCAEFGLTERRWPAYLKAYPKPIVYAVGKSRPNDWPYIHPSTADRWAEARVHPFTVAFTAKRVNRRPLHLIVGIADAHPTLPAVVTAAVNGVVLPNQRAPTGPGEMAHDPRANGKPDALVFTIKPGTIRRGRNTLRITLDGGSYVIYDYVMLTADRKPPKITPRKSVDLIERALSGPLADVEEIVYACRQEGPDGHWYANFAYYAQNDRDKTYRAMGRLCKLNVRTRKVTVLLDDPKGTVRDPAVHYDGKKILFSYRKGGSESFHLYEIDADGKRLRQLTDGPFDDIEPIYLPDGDIVFVSSRCKRWVNCWLTPVAILYRCDANGGNIRPISGNIEHDNTPWVLPDGRLIYQRWEYIDRSQVHYHHLWTCNPDGTGQINYYGNMHPGTVMIDAKPIPGGDKVLAVFSPRHGRREHAGAITIVTPRTGPDDPTSAERVSRGEDFRDPFPLSEDCFLVARNNALLIMNGRGDTQTLHALPEKLTKLGVKLHEPRPLKASPREAVIPPRVDLSEKTGRLLLTDVREGRRMDGVKPGEITQLLVLEALPKPINYTGGMEPLSYGGTFTLERVLGTVPVEPDGSAYMEVPAMRSLFFVALDDQGNSIKRMQSFLTVMPGETTSCVGCHERRTRTPVNPTDKPLLAARRKPNKIAKIDGMPDVFDFPRDIQPIFDKHCVTCHGVEHRKGGVLLTGDRGPMYSHSYYMLTVRRQVSDGRNLAKSNYRPRALGASASLLMKKIGGRHHDVKVSEREREMIRLWIETGGAYPGTYAALGSGMIGGYARNRIDRFDTKWPSVKAAMGAMKRRCTSCHVKNRRLPTSPTDDLDMRPWGIRSGDPRFPFTRHIVYNLTRPTKSVLLLAPLSKRAGGYGICMETTGGATRAVFADTDDPDYGRLLAAIRDAHERLDTIKRFDMPGFRPPPPYVREMKRYGVLPEDLAVDAPLDVYRTDRAYWRSLWWPPRAGIRSAMYSRMRGRGTTANRVR